MKNSTHNPLSVLYTVIDSNIAYEMVMSELNRENHKIFHNLSNKKKKPMSFLGKEREDEAK